MRSAARPPTVIGVNFDPVGPFPNLLANYPGQAVDTVGFFGALGYIPFRCETFWSVTAGGDDGPSSNQQTRSGNDSLLDRLL